MALICLSTGCWQEIEYQPSDAPTASSRRPSRGAADVVASAPAVALVEQKSTRPQDVAEAESQEEIAVDTSPADTEIADVEGSLQEPQEPEQSIFAPVADAENSAADLPDFIRNENEHSVSEEFTPDNPPSTVPRISKAREEETAGIFPIVDDQQPTAAIQPSANETQTSPAESEQSGAKPDNTRLVAWKLGNRLSLAALARDRGLVPSDAARWQSEAHAAAEKLGTFFSDFPPTASQRNTSEPTVHDYLAQQGQQIWRQLSDGHGEDHAGLFEMAVKSNVLLVLYQPGASVSELLGNSIRDAGRQANLPPELSQPLFDAIAAQAPPAKVREAIRRLHAEVERHLSTPVEP